ncbi:hypothetical protein ACN27J_10790 [Solwaraspora sp. WMMB762]|uniref:hypothetical protein n=1 Tax=Solwaraspora sp. WMMB762 TaxID=3404120 RepID=UPI003B95D151
MPQRKQPSASTSGKVVRSAKTAFYVTRVTAWSEGKRVRAARIRAAGQRAADTAEAAQRQDKQVMSSSPEPESDKINLPSFVGMLRSGHGDLAARAKEIVRGTDVK